MARTRGFTLLELMVVIVIVASISTLAGVNLVGRERSDIESVARTLMTDLRYVRSRAMVDNIDTEISFDLAANSYASRQANIERSLPKTLSLRLTIDQHEIGDSRGKIVFYPDGSSSGGEIRLLKSGRTLEVATSWLNGYVELR